MRGVRTQCAHCGRPAKLRARGLCGSCCNVPDRRAPYSPVKPQKEWTALEVRRLKEMRDSGATRSEIAAALGRTRSQVRGMLQRVGFSPRYFDALVSSRTSTMPES